MQRVDWNNLNSKLEKFDAVVVGAGILGLTITYSLIESNPNIKVLVIEKEKAPGLHASGRNSGVLHSGIYYNPGSLKSKFSAQGNSEMKEFCFQEGIPVSNVGKVIVCSSESDLGRLEQLYTQGQKANLNVEIRESSELARFEPLAKTVGGFIWSPDTAVVNPRQVMDSLTRRLRSSGVHFAFNSDFVVESDNSILVNDSRIQFGLLINAAGVNADKIAHEYGVGLQLQMFPIMGSYWKTNSENLPLKTLVYPVPNPANPFLGVHFTITTDGKIKLGPTVTPIPSRFGYKMWPPDSFKEMFEIIGAGISLLKGKENNLPKILLESIKSLTLEGVVGNARELVPAATQVKFWEKTIPGTRAQLVDQKRGILVQDFMVEKSGKTIHILNGISPGWTASFPFARWIVDQYVN